MTMTGTADETNGTLRPIDAGGIGALVRAVGVMQGWTQGTLADWPACKPAPSSGWSSVSPAAWTRAER